MNEYKRSSEIDPETLAAFIDGKLDARERARVIEALRDPELYESLMEASAIHAELSQAATREPQVISILDRFQKSKRWKVAVPTAAAAVLATILVVSRIIQSGTGPETLALLQNAAWYDKAQQSGAQSMLGAKWSEVEWPGTRGVTSTDTSSAAFRAGVLLVDRDFAATTKDDAARAAKSLELSRVLATVPGGGPASALASANNESSLNDLSDSMKELFNDSPWYSLGTWWGQARLAALGGDMSCFAPDAPCTRELTDVRDRLANDPATQANTNAVAVVDHINALLAQINSGEVNKAALSESLQSIKSLAASR